MVEEAGRISNGVNDGLGVFLERREITDIKSNNQLAMQNLATFQNLKRKKTGQ